MKNYLQKIVLLLFVGAAIQANAQSVGTPGSTTVFFDTNAAGGLLGHREGGTFGDINPGNQWIGIGQPTSSIIPPSFKIPAYGFRSQWDGSTGIFAVKENSVTGAKDLAVEWGSANASALRFSFITNQFNPSALTEVMTLTSPGFVGIGNTSPEALLDLSYTTSTSTNFGIRNQVTLGPSGLYSYGIDNRILSGSSYILYGFSNILTSFNSYGTIVNNNTANGSGQYIYGVYANVTNTSSSGSTYGVYGRATGNATVWAGFFQGDVYVSGSISHASDKKFKKDIKNVVSKELKPGFMKLRPTTYNYNNSDQMRFAEGLQYGFVAQEVEKVFPDLVKNVVEPVFVKDANGNDIPSETEVVEFKSVNYTGMIPILTKIVQGHEAEMDALKAENELLNQRFNDLLTALESGQLDQIKKLIDESKTTLGQNQPNPFGQLTKITYNIAQSVQEASILVYDSNGALVGNYELEKGTNTLDLQANALQPGIYVYVMVADGETIGTRRMIVTQ